MALTKLTIPVFMRRPPAIIADFRSGRREVQAGCGSLGDGGVDRRAGRSAFSLIRCASSIPVSGGIIRGGRIIDARPAETAIQEERIVFGPLIIDSGPGLKGQPGLRRAPVRASCANCDFPALQEANGLFRGWGVHLRGGRSLYLERSQNRCQTAGRESGGGSGGVSLR